MTSNVVAASDGVPQQQWTNCVRDCYCNHFHSRPSEFQMIWVLDTCWTWCDWLKTTTWFPMMPPALKNASLQQMQASLMLNDRRFTHHSLFFVPFLLGSTCWLRQIQNNKCPITHSCPAWNTHQHIVSMPCATNAKKTTTSKTHMIQLVHFVNLLWNDISWHLVRAKADQLCKRPRWHQRWLKR